METVEDKVDSVPRETENTEREIAQADANGQLETLGLSITPKKKKKKKKKKKQIDSLTEELLFIDPGEKEIDDNERYSLSRSVTVRIETAIQRFKETRKFSSTRNQVFSSYLRFGGVKTGPNQFQGQQDVEDPEATSEDITMRKSTDFIQEDEDDDDEPIVDFTYVVKTYLSSYFIDKSGYVQMEQFREAPLVVSSFLNYLIRHNVCPEYLEDIQGAIKIADHAKIELPNCKGLALTAFHKFNKACSLLYGGELYGMLDDPWDPENVVKCIKISLDEAKEIITKVFGKDALENFKRVTTRKALKVEIVNIEKPRTEDNLENGEDNKEEKEEKKNDDDDNKEKKNDVDDNKEKKNDVDDNKVKKNDVDDNKVKKNDVDDNKVKKNDVDDNKVKKNDVDDNKEKKNDVDDNKEKKNDVDNKEKNDSDSKEKKNDDDDDMIILYKMTIRTCEEPTVETFDVHIDVETSEYATAGMFLIADFHQLSNGWWYYDSVTNVYPSYYEHCEDSDDEDD